MKAQNINEVKNWLKNKDFDKGVAILAKYRKGMARILQNQGPKRLNKLEYELKKLAGIDRKEAVVTPAKPHQFAPTAPLDVHAKPDNQQTQNTNQQTPNNKQQTLTKKLEDFVDLSKAHSSLSDIPKDIEAIAKEHARLYRLRSQLAGQRQKLPGDNKPETVKNRKILTESIHELSSHIERLFEAHKNYMQNRQKPDMDELFPTTSKEQQTTNNKQQTTNNKQSATGNLKKQRSNLMSANRRDRTTLNYQSSKKKAKKNPMPEGTERTKIEERIKERLQEIEALEKQIKEATKK